MQSGRKILQIHPSQHCNYTCEHCYSSSSPRLKSYIPKERLLTTIKEAFQMGYTTLSVSGGEPMMYPDLCAILETAKEVGMSTSLITNGSFKESEYRKLEGVLDTIAVSLDGDEQAHDRIRKHTGAFSKVDRFLDFIPNIVSSYGIVYSLSDQSWDSLPSMLTYAESKKVDIIQIHPVEEIGRARDSREVTLSSANLKRAFLLLSTLSCQLPFFIQMDLVTKQGGTRKLVPNLEGNQPADVIDLLVVDEQGRVLPYSYGINDDWMISNINSTNLHDGWIMFNQRLKEFYDWCHHKFDSVEESLISPSFVFNN